MTHLSAHGILHFRRHHAGWEIDDARAWKGCLFYIALIEPAGPAGREIAWSIQSLHERCTVSTAGCHAQVPGILFDEVVARHRSAIVNCLEWHLRHAIGSLDGAFAQVRELRVAIAEIEK